MNAGRFGFHPSSVLHISTRSTLLSCHAAHRLTNAFVGTVYQDYNTKLVAGVAQHNPTLFTWEIAISDMRLHIVREKNIHGPLEVCHLTTAVISKREQARDPRRGRDGSGSWRKRALISTALLFQADVSATRSQIEKLSTHARCRNARDPSYS